MKDACSGPHGLAHKHTEIGPIPQDWDIRRLGDVAHIYDGTHQTPRYVSDGVPFYSVEQVTSGDFTRTKFISEQEHRLLTRSYKIERGDVLMTRIGSIGECRFVDWDVKASFYVSLALLKVHDVDAQYLAQLSNSQTFKWEIELHSLPSAIPKKINLGPISDVRIPYPPRTEQREIAIVLGDVDALLAGLDRLIAKKRDLKQAAMQQLLTGQTRLPGFNRPWQRKPLAEVLAICHGKSQGDVEVPDGPYPILATGGRIGTASKALYDKPSVLIGRKGTINQPQYMDTPFWTVDTLFYSAMKARHCAKFFYYRFCLIDWMQFNEASGVPSLSARTIEKIEVDCPEPEEQMFIAATLSDMDDEIAAIERRLTKTRAVKQAMMQELLTGRIRLI
jgi:type I restriction enzyme S subunit